MAGIAHRCYFGPPETLSPPFSPLCPWIHGLFPAIEFVVVPSSPLPNSGDPGATLACASLNSGDFTAVERSGTARSRLFPRQSLYVHHILRGDNDYLDMVFTQVSLEEVENLCWYELPNESWEVNLPAQKVSPELLEPTLGINFARDGI
ncbi:hypothetical protein ZEAMMB73_Zm00001d015238 [Zea mays]|uniref:PHD finger protein ALFIN-LIKE n=1 Tax=Zea mays TaxID=4577 RepID=A0A1D6H0B5_MAIZE|nr:hypothetical protein ZEAMMB73_Zm00001d015238 [Zea mays]